MRSAHGNPQVHPHHNRQAQADDRAGNGRVFLRKSPADGAPHGAPPSRCHRRRRHDRLYVGGNQHPARRSVLPSAHEQDDQDRHLGHGEHRSGAQGAAADSGAHRGAVLRVRRRRTAGQGSRLPCARSSKGKAIKPDLHRKDPTSITVDESFGAVSGSFRIKTNPAR